jgi:hypothetical protein
MHVIPLGKARGGNARLAIPPCRFRKCHFILQDSLFNVRRRWNTFSAAFIAALQFHEKVSGTLQAEAQE